MDSQQVEKIARAMWAAETGNHPSGWEHIHYNTRQSFRESAETAIRAYNVRHLLNEMAAGVQ